MARRKVRVKVGDIVSHRRDNKCRLIVTEVADDGRSGVCCTTSDTFGFRIARGCWFVVPPRSKPKRKGNARWAGEKR